MYKIKKKGRKSKNFNIMYSALTTELTRSNFRRIDLKGEGNKYYFSFIDKLLNIELCFEPCMNGFEVAMYGISKGPFRFFDLIGKKICTNLKELIFKKEEDVYKKNSGEELPKELLDKLRTTELYYGTLERSERAWDKALAIAKKLYRIKRNEQRIRNWKLVEDEENVQKAPYSPPSTPHYPPPSPPAYPPYTTTPDTWKATAANNTPDPDGETSAPLKYLPSS